MPRASSNACRRPTSGSSSVSSADGAELPNVTGRELLAAARLCANVTFANASESVLNVTAALAGRADACGNRIRH